MPYPRHLLNQKTPQLPLHFPFPRKKSDFSLSPANYFFVRATNSLTLSGIPRSYSFCRTALPKLQSDTNFPILQSLSGVSQPSDFELKLTQSSEVTITMCISTRLLQGFLSNRFIKELHQKL